MGLKVECLRFDHDGTPLLDGLDLAARRGDCTFLLGPSGSGKSTLLRSIAGLERPAAGSITLDGRILDPLPPHMRRVGLLFQEPTLFPHLDARQNVAFGLRYAGVARGRRKAMALDWLDRVGLGHRHAASPDELSGGERQRVCLARTLATRPRAVLLDEPLSALDRELRVRLGGDVKQILQEADVPVVWVTHDEEEADRLGDQVLRLVDGRAVPA